MVVKQEPKDNRPECPCCHQGVLYQTGAFSVCDHCGLAITRQALAYAERTLARDEDEDSTAA